MRAVVLPQGTIETCGGVGKRQVEAVGLQV